MVVMVAVVVALVAVVVAWEGGGPQYPPRAYWSNTISLHEYYNREYTTDENCFTCCGFDS